MSGFKVSKGKGLRQANRQLESMGCITQLQHHPHLGFSLHIRLTFMEHKFGHSDTLECCFLGHISTFPGSFPAFADLSPTQVCLRAKRGELEQVVGDGADHARGQVVLSFLSIGDLFQSFLRMRELCKGLYSSTYEDSINSKVKQYIREVKNSFIYSSLFWRGLFSVPQKICKAILC